MAVNAHLKLQGIKGESQHDKHKNEIDVLSWSWGMAQMGTHHMGGGGGAGKVDVHDLVITKMVDKASPDLMLHCCNGKHINDGTLSLKKAGEDAMEYLKIKMKDILVTSVSTGGHEGDEKQTENVSFNFAEVEVEYHEQTEKGRPMAPAKFGWKIDENKKK